VLARAIASGHKRVCAITAERTVRCVVRRLVDSRGAIDMRVETLDGVDDAEELFVLGRATCVTRSDDRSGALGMGGSQADPWIKCSRGRRASTAFATCERWG
jgi:hypothetical protein